MPTSKSDISYTPPGQDYPPRAEIITRRGTELGAITTLAAPGSPDLAYAKTRWQNEESVFLPGIVSAGLPPFAESLAQSHRVYEAVLDGMACQQWLDEDIYRQRYSAEFELLSSSYDAADGQQIERVDFDALREGGVAAEEIWMKASWLSYADDDASLRFRFSFGLDGYEDVGADFEREQYAARLAELVFPESAVIPDSPALQDYLRAVTGRDRLAFIERIVYFNAPNGGAQFHQDVEGVHLGIVFAQLTGRTAWLSLPKSALVREIATFLQMPGAESLLKQHRIKPIDRRSLLALANDPPAISEALDTPDAPGLERLINHVPSFFGQLVRGGYAYTLQPGDVLLLPQRDLQHCNWHSVFCLDETPGEALSFAVREIP